MHLEDRPLSNLSENFIRTMGQVLAEKSGGQAVP
jgi:hypothetical protein